MGHIALDIGGSLIKLVYFSPGFSQEGSPAQHTPNTGGGLCKRCCCVYAAHMH